MSNEATPPRRNLWAEASLFVAVLPMAAWIAAGHLHSPELAVLMVACTFLTVFAGWMGRRTSKDGPREARIVANFGFGLGLLNFGCCALFPSNVEDWPGARRAHSMNNLKQIQLALVQYQSVHGRFPPAAIRDRDGRPLYSWRVAILPFMDARDLYDDFHLDEPWDSPHNRKLLDRMPATFRSPSSTYPGSRSLTHYQSILGPGSAFENPEGATLGPPEKSELADGLRRRGMQFDETRASRGDFPDGIDSTLMILAARQPVDWSRPADVTILPGVPIPPLGEGGMSRRTLFGDPGIRGFNVAFVDGHVRTFPLTTPESTLRALFSRNGGEAIPLGDE